MAVPDRHILICTGDHCRKRGGKKLCKAFKEVIDERGMKRQVKVVPTECMGQCSNGPMTLVYPDTVWYAGLERAEVEEVVDRHLIAGKPVTNRLYRRVHGPKK